MPLPVPNSGEAEQDFMSRCMADPTTVNEFPDDEQRAAVCRSQWEKPKNIEQAREDAKSEPELHRKGFAATKGLSVDVAERTVDAMITTNSVDEEGEVILPEGIDLTRFMKSPTVFWNHSYDQPIGTATEISRTGSGLRARTRFMERPESHPEGVEWFPDTVLAMFDAGVVRGFSIGFAYLESRSPSGKDLERLAPADEREIHAVITKSRLMEYSVAPLPMNEDALVLAVSRGFVTRKGALSVLGKSAVGALTRARVPDRRLSVRHQSPGDAPRSIAIPGGPRIQVEVAKPVDAKRVALEVSQRVRRELEVQRGRVYAPDE